MEEWPAAAAHAEIRRLQVSALDASTNSWVFVAYSVPVGHKPCDGHLSGHQCPNKYNSQLLLQPCGCKTFAAGQPDDDHHLAPTKQVGMLKRGPVLHLPPCSYYDIMLAPLADALREALAISAREETIKPPPGKTRPVVYFALQVRVCNGCCRLVSHTKFRIGGSAAASSIKVLLRQKLDQFVNSMRQVVIE